MSRIAVRVRPKNDFQLEVLADIPEYTGDQHVLCMTIGDAIRLRDVLNVALNAEHGPLYTSEDVDEG